MNKRIVTMARATVYSNLHIIQNRRCNYSSQYTILHFDADRHTYQHPIILQHDASIIVCMFHTTICLTLNAILMHENLACCGWYIYIYICGPNLHRCNACIQSVITDELQRLHMNVAHWWNSSLTDNEFNQNDWSSLITVFQWCWRPTCCNMCI